MLVQAERAYHLAAASGIFRDEAEASSLEDGRRRVKALAEVAFDKDVHAIESFPIGGDASESDLQRLERLITDVRRGASTLERGSSDALRPLLSRRSEEVKAVRAGRRAEEEDKEQKKKGRAAALPSVVAQAIWDPSENTTARVLDKREPGFMPFRAEALAVRAAAAAADRRRRRSFRRRSRRSRTRRCMMRRRRARWANWRQPSPPVPKSIGTTRQR